AEAQSFLRISIMVLVSLVVTSVGDCSPGACVVCAVFGRPAVGSDAGWRVAAAEDAVVLAGGHRRSKDPEEQGQRREHASHARMVTRNPWAIKSPWRCAAGRRRRPIYMHRPQPLPGAQPLALAQQSLADHRRRALGDLRLGRLAARQRLLLAVVLDEVA